MAKALLLFSGGLDSILAAKILLKQKIKIVPICFQSYFFDCKLAEESAKKLRLKVRIVNFDKKHLKIVKSPEYGHGKGMNPCIDCHLLMLKEAKKIMEKENIDFIATGDVLGERPFSQNREALIKMEKEANLKKMILRPLSAKLLPKTIPEELGLIKRENLFDFKGKSRKPQIKLARELRVSEFPSPAGGCLLTDPQYSQKLKVLFKKVPDFNGKDCQVLKRGRIFWRDNFLIVVGRNEKENKELKKLKKKEDLILEPENFPGPTVLIRGFGKKVKKEVVKKGIELLINYSKKIPETLKISLLQREDVIIRKKRVAL